MRGKEFWQFRVNVRDLFIPAFRLRDERLFEFVPENEEKDCMIDRKAKERNERHMQRKGCKPQIAQTSAEHILRIPNKRRNTARICSRRKCREKGQAR